MRSLWLEAAKTVSWREVAEPTLIDSQDALVRPLAVARCDLDPIIAWGLYPMAMPMAIGHEMAGEVIAVGDRAGPWRPGDRVIVPFQISCGQCAMCERGLTNACLATPPGAAFGLGERDGVDYGSAFADVVRVPFADHMLLALPDGLSPEAACGIPDNVADGYRTVAGPLETWPGEAVLVVGGLAPSVGLYAAAAALALGSPVRYVDSDAGRLDIADSLGAEVDDRPYGEIRDLSDFAVTVDTCVLDPGRDLALRATRPCGHCTSVSGGAGARSELPLQAMYLKGITYDIGRVHGRATAPAVLDLVTSGRLDPLAIRPTIASFDDGPTAMLASDPKVIFRR